MNKQELVHKYAKKCDQARVKMDELRRSYYNNKGSNPVEAQWDILEREAYARQFSICEEILNDLNDLS